MENRMQALELVTRRLVYFNSFYNFKYNKVTIKNQSSRWGSCSRKGNINFNYRLALIPPELADYVIVHELCHLGQLNHSRKFWELVERTMPNWRELRARLKGEEGKKLF
jgi:predicted metal-dependent hydrolase